MASEIVIKGEPIPGDELGPVEALKWWHSIQQQGRVMVGTVEVLAVKLAEWWDRKGVDHMKWDAPAAFMATCFDVTEARIYQLIGHGRARWHLSTRVEKPVLAQLTEGTLRPAIRRDVSMKRLPQIVERARVLADEEAKIKQKTGPVTIRKRHITAVLRDEEGPIEKSGPRVQHARRKGAAYVENHLTTPLDDLEGAIQAALDMAGKVKCNPSIPELLRRAMKLVRPEAEAKLV